jgi:DMSO/TMAO reductase YedYZ molybdopterin-dependent catalytic subunit
MADRDPTAPVTPDPDADSAGLPDRPRELRIGRAAFLATVAAGVGGIFLGPRLSQWVNTPLQNALPSGLGDLIPGEGWRIYNVQDPMPTFHPATYRLVVDGLVERPASLNWREVIGLPGESQTSTFHCVTGWTVDGVRWEGIRARTLVDLVRPRATAGYVTFQSLEAPYVDQLTLAQFMLPDVMIARQMNGGPISRSHGAPLRLVIPDMYGYKGVKWLSSITFTDRPMPGFWEVRGYDVDAWVARSNGYG